MKLVAIFCLFILFAAPPTYGSLDWKDIDPAELARTEPKIDPNADAETIFWDVWVEDDVRSAREPYVQLRHYVRMKIYTEKGVEDQSTVELVTVGRKHALTAVSGRTTLPDGTVVPLENDAIFDKDIVRNKYFRAKGKSFSMPAVEPGAIIEYQWREIRNSETSHNMRLDFQRDTPAWRIIYNLKPSPVYYDRLGLLMYRHGMNMQLSELEDVGLGFKSMYLANVPAFREEPYMPPESSVRPWTLLYYAPPGQSEPEKYWRNLSKDRYASYEKFIKVDKKIKAAAAEITAGAKTDEEKVEKILRFCQTEVANIYHDSSGMTSEERDAVDENKKPIDTYEQRKGTSWDINLLFTTLVRGAGLESRRAWVAGRDRFIFNAQLMSDYMLNRTNVAVKIGDGWNFYDPSAPYLQSGMLSWPEEGVHALVSDPKELLFIQTPFSEPEKTQARRVGKFTLDEEGTLEGDVHLIYTGHLGYTRKANLDGLTGEERIEDFTESLERLYSNAEVEAVEIGNVLERDKPIEFQYHIKIPNYAQATGKRLFIPVSFFHYKRSPRFTASERQWDIEFDYAWQENDHVEINLPEGYRLDNADAPGGSNFGTTGGFELSLQTNPEEDILIFDRKLTWGSGGAISFPASAYTQLKGAWDFVVAQDQHMISVKREEGSVGGAE